MKQISLSKTGKNKGLYFALVDDWNYDYLNQFSWHVVKHKDKRYARRITVDGFIYMHKEIMALKGNGMIDHEDGNGLNCQEYNLRFSNYSQNNANKKSAKNSTSKYIGVHWFTRKKKWKAQIQKDKKVICLGSYDDEEIAAMAYDKAAKEIHGEFANLNFKMKSLTNKDK